MRANVVRQKTWSPRHLSSRKDSCEENPPRETSVYGAVAKLLPQWKHVGTKGSPPIWANSSLRESRPRSIRVEEAREKIGLVFERGMKVPLQHEESIEIRHDVGFMASLIQVSAFNLFLFLPFVVAWIFCQKRLIFTANRLPTRSLDGSISS